MKMAITLTPIDKSYVSLFYFVFIVGISCIGTINAQSVTEASDYTTSQLKYMMRKGFDPYAYNWTNNEVNHLLNEALVVKRGTGGIVLLGLGTSYSCFVLGAAMALGNNEYSESEVNNVFYIGSGLLISAITWAIFKRNKAGRRVRMATSVYQASKRQRNKPVFDNFFRRDN